LVGIAVLQALVGAFLFARAVQAQPEAQPGSVVLVSTGLWIFAVLIGMFAVELGRDA
jgi:hypothetical protein